MTLVLAMTLLGPAPAVAIAVAAVTVDAVRSRPDRLMLLIELTAFAVFPLAGGLLLSAVDDRIDLNDTGAVYAVAVVLGFMLANVLNFVLVVVPKFWSQGVSMQGIFRTIYYRCCHGTSAPACSLRSPPRLTACTVWGDRPPRRHALRLSVVAALCRPGRDARRRTY